MLNISKESIGNKVNKSNYKTFSILENKQVTGILIKILSGMVIVGVLAMFLPWTQNIRSKGYVTTLSPDDRPQTVQSLIGGRIEKWYVMEGQRVEKGDTIIKISEVKEEYLDPDLLDNTRNQITAKEESASAYGEKAMNLEKQYNALVRNLDVKLEQNRIKTKQTKLKLQSDSIDLEAAKVKLDIAEYQLRRIQQLYDEGLKSLTDLEAKRLSFQESQAKVVSLQNKVAANRNELDNLIANEEAIKNDFADKIAKSRSEMMTALSNQYTAIGDINKLESSYNAYSVRQDNYYIVSPIDGIVTKAIQSGIGEMIKNGDKIVSIMPDRYRLAIEMYVKPMDVPLLDIGQEVRIQFDGWPSIVFSGWPNASVGTFGGKVFAIDNFISDNGLYRIMVAPDPSEIPWPKEVRVGGGANTITLLKDVFVGYEIWRQLNGFPADYYKETERKDAKTKQPLRKVEKI